MTKDLLVALDIGGTKLAGALLSTAGDLLYRCETPTCQSGMEDSFQQISNMVDEILRQGKASAQQVLGIGIGLPAVLEKETDLVIWAPNIRGWRNFSLRTRLQEATHLPVYLEYDGHTAVLGEWWKGAGHGHNTIAMLVVGTGVGGGIVIDGRLWRGVDRLAGAVGWFAMTGDHSLEYPDSRTNGHWETLVAGPGIARRARERLTRHPASLLRSLSPEDISARHVFEYARQKDALCCEIVEETAYWLGMGLANIVDLINPEVIVLGGSVGRQGDVLLPGIQAMLDKWAQPVSARSVRVMTAQLDANVGLYGAAYAAILRS